MARIFRKTIASERNILSECAPGKEEEEVGQEEEGARERGGESKTSRSTPKRGSLNGFLEESERIGERTGERIGERIGERKRQEGKTSSSVTVAQGVADTTSAPVVPRVSGRSKRQHRSLKAALAYSRKDEEQQATTTTTKELENNSKMKLEGSSSSSSSSSSAAVSPTNSETSVSTVTESSPSPNSSEEGRRSSRRGKATTMEGEEEEMPPPQHTPRGAWSHRPSSAKSLTSKKGGEKGSSNTLAGRRKQRKGFGAFRVPKGAKRFVHTTLDEVESLTVEELQSRR